MQKIELPTKDEKYNNEFALKCINKSGMSRKDMFINFIHDSKSEKNYALITIGKEEKNQLPDLLRQTAISYKNLKTNVLS